MNLGDCVDSFRFHAEVTVLRLGPLRGLKGLIITVEHRELYLAGLCQPFAQLWRVGRGCDLAGVLPMGNTTSVGTVIFSNAMLATPSG